MTWLKAVCLTLLSAVAMASPISIGSKFPIATAHKQMGFGAAYDGTNYMMAIQGDAASSWNVGAQLFSASGVSVGGYISTGRTGDSPVVAFDGTNYLLVWTDYEHTPNDDIWGCFISKNGVRGNPFMIAQPSSRQVVSGLIFDGTNYLVVWNDYRNDVDGGTGTDIYGQLVSTTGTLVGTEIAICTQADDQLDSAIAFSGNKSLVVWMSRRSQNPIIWDVYGCFVKMDGTVSVSARINETDCPNSQNPIGVAFGGSNGFFVTWGKDVGLGGENPAIWDVYGRAVSLHGSYVSPEIAISTASGIQAFPRVASNGSSYLVVWTDLTNPDVEISGRLYSDTGVVQTDAFPIVLGNGPRAVFPLTYAGGKYLVGVMEGLQVNNWGIADVYGLFLDPNGVSATTLQVSVDPGRGYLGAYGGMKLNYSLVGPKSYSGPLTLNSSGKTLLEGIEPGSYTLSLTGSHWLKRVVSSLTVDGTSGVNTMLTNGDADGGNSINLFDFVVLDSKFNSSDAMADLNGDGMVNLFDYVVIDENFGAQGD